MRNQFDCTFYFTLQEEITIIYLEQATKKFTYVFNDNINNLLNIECHKNY